MKKTQEPRVKTARDKTVFGSYGTLMTQMDMIEWDRSPVAEFIEASDTIDKISPTSIVPSTGSGTEKIQQLCSNKYSVAELMEKPGGPEVPLDRSPVAEFIEASR